MLRCTHKITVCYTDTQVHTQNWVVCVATVSPSNPQQQVLRTEDDNKNHYMIESGSEKSKIRWWSID